LKPAQARLEALEKRHLSHHYIQGTPEFDSALLKFFLSVKSKACSGCRQDEEDAEDDEAVMCIQNCPAFDQAEADLAKELLMDGDILHRLLYERIMGTRHG